MPIEEAAFELKREENDCYSDIRDPGLYNEGACSFIAKPPKIEMVSDGEEVQADSVLSFAQAIPVTTSNELERSSSCQQLEVLRKPCAGLPSGETCADDSGMTMSDRQVFNFRECSQSSTINTPYLMAAETVCSGRRPMDIASAREALSCALKKAVSGTSSPSVSKPEPTSWRPAKTAVRLRPIKPKPLFDSAQIAAICLVNETQLSSYDGSSLKAPDAVTRTEVLSNGSSLSDHSVDPSISAMAEALGAEPSASVTSDKPTAFIILPAQTADPVAQKATVRPRKVKRKLGPVQSKDVKRRLGRLPARDRPLIAPPLDSSSTPNLSSRVPPAMPTFGLAGFLPGAFTVACEVGQGPSGFVQLPKEGNDCVASLGFTTSAVVASNYSNQEEGLPVKWHVTPCSNESDVGQTLASQDLQHGQPFATPAISFTILPCTAVCLSPMFVVTTSAP